MRFIYVDFPFLGQESFDAAEAAHCAQDQGKFWEYHDLLFENHTGENVGDYKRENLDKFAQKLGLDMAQFGQCMNSHKYLDFIRAELSEGRRIGVNSTPSLVVNQRLLPGFIPFHTERNERSLIVAPAATLNGQELLKAGSEVCLKGQVDDKRRISSLTALAPPGDNDTTCGLLKKFTAPTATTGGEIVIEQDEIGLKDIIERELKGNP